MGENVDHLWLTADDETDDAASEVSDMEIDPKYEQFSPHIFRNQHSLHPRDVAVGGIEALVLSFLAQLDSVLNTKATEEGGSVLISPKPKIELQVTNRFKRTQDGYGFWLPWEFSNKPAVQYHCP